MTPPAGGRGEGGPDQELVDCPLCGSAGYSVVIDDCPDRLLGTPGRYRIVRCSECALVRTNPRPTPEAMAGHYPPDYLPFRLDDQGGAGTRLRHALQAGYKRRFGSPDLIVAPPAEGPRRLLDLGAGSGVYASRMAEAGWDVWALEPSPGAAAAAAERLGSDRVFSGLLEDATYPEGQFDLVTMGHVLEHLHDPVDAVGRIARWIRPGGALQAVVPNVASLERKALRSYWLGFDLPRHLFHYTPPTVRRVLESSGYVVESIKPQWLPSMFAQSVGVAISAMRGRSGYGRLAYYAAYPVGALLATLGSSGGMTVTARVPG